VPYIPIDLQTIKLQNKYFGYASEWLMHLWPEYEHLTGQELSSPRSKSPQIIPQPPRDNRPPK
jgi:hypothetical protein